MKNRPSSFHISAAFITAAALCCACPLSSYAQTASNPPAGTVTITPAATVTQAPTLPYGAGEVLKMYQGGINKDVILNYINNTSLSYRLSADGIIYLQSLGVPQELTKAMI